MHEKSVRNKMLKEFEWRLLSRTACVMRGPPLVPARPRNKYQFESIAGFNQHPNSSEQM